MIVTFSKILRLLVCVKPPGINVIKFPVHTNFHSRLCGFFI